MREWKLVRPSKRLRLFVGVGVERVDVGAAEALRCYGASNFLVYVRRLREIKHRGEIVGLCVEHAKGRQAEDRLDEANDRCLAARRMIDALDDVR